ncbi:MULTISPECIES: DUF5662 family protein [Bacillus cereus group]|uniref:DUF5662 family protein n=1 Tax=Bacillus cereus group TaxID=86661 RepID=UPI000279B7CC|nr:DUF5662 family protein [Bacillus cereus]EJR82273.1 hypothetical protein IKA_05405 [Bacillus cereus VD169]MDA2491371.1 DUF5662 family protein [Bacillus cereus]MDZ4621214.1 DUF5662 family protein [Bacillus cereus]NRS81697.1 hypothetical protein [Bacillus cereus]
MSNYRKDIINHKEKVSNNIKRCIDELYMRQLYHDNDKITNDIIFNSYDQYNDELRKKDFHSKEYKEFLNTKLGKAIEIHSQNRHHFNSMQCKTNFSIDLIDILELICDVKAAIERDGELTQEEVLKLLQNALINIRNLPSINDLIGNTINNLFSEIGDYECKK